MDLILCKNGKNRGMDFVLFGILSFYSVRGFLKGFLSMIFSLLGVFFVAIVSWKLAEVFLPTVQNYAGGAVFETIKKLIDGIVPGKFSSLSEFQSALSLSSIGAIFSVFVTKLFENITFDGALSAGQILAPTLSNILTRLLTFLLIFIILEVFLKILRFLLNKIIKKCGFSIGNRILGGLVGLLKGVFVFGIVFAVLSILANVLLNDGLLEFVKSGSISNFLYNNLIAKIVNMIY